MRTARVFNQVGDVHVEWRPPFIGRIRALGVSAIVASTAVVALVMLSAVSAIGFTATLILGGVVSVLTYGTVLRLNSMINSMSDLGGSGTHADIGEWTQIKMVLDGIRRPVVTNTRYTLGRKD